MSFSSLILSLCCGTVGSGLYGRAGLSSGLADRSSHQPLVRAIVRSHHDLVVSSMTGKSARESQRRHGQSSDIKTGQTTHL